MPGESCLRRPRLQKLFSSFPDGWPGVGLFLLRFTVACGAALEACNALDWTAVAILPRWSAAILATMVGLALLAGLFTPIASALAAGGNLAFGIWCLAYGGFAESPRLMSFSCLTVISFALLFLGPGAFSLDARLFGRREIIIPESRRPPGS